MRILLIFFAVVSVAHAGYDDYVSPYEKTIETRSCSAAPDVMIIDEVADWTNANLNDAAIKTYCVKPGDYSSAGKMTLTKQATANVPIVVRYYSESDNGYHPYKQFTQAPATLATIPRLDFTSAKHWQFTRLHNTDQTPNAKDSVHIQAPASDIVFDQMFMGENWGNIFRIEDGADDVTVQGSVVRSARAADPNNKGVHCFSVGANNADGNMDNIHVVDNEIYNCFADGFQINHAQKPNDTTGVSFVIDNNDLYITPKLYTDGNGNYTNDPDSVYACSENAVDIKVTGQPGQSVSKVTHNRIWGYRNVEPNTGLCDQHGGVGTAVVMHRQAGAHGVGVDFSDNIIMDSRFCLILDKGDPKNISVNRNLFFGCGHDAISSNATQFAIRDNSDQKNEFYWNIIKGVDTNPGKWFDFQAKGNDVRNNTIVAADPANSTMGAGGTVGYNYFAVTTPYTGSGYVGGNISDGTVGAANLDPFCFTRKKLTSPEQVCIDDVLPTESSPQYGNLDQNVGSEANRGIDDNYPVDGTLVFDDSGTQQGQTLGVIYLATLIGEEFAEGTRVNYWVLDWDVDSSPSTAPAAAETGSVYVGQSSDIIFGDLSSMGLSIGDPVVYILEAPTYGYLGAYPGVVQ